MRDLERGFAVDGRFLPFGTSLAEACHALGAELPEGPGYRWARVRCGEAFGLETLSAELGGPAPDRPVLEVVYELAAGTAPSAWFAAVARELGAPARSEEREVPRHADPAGAVTRYGHWRCATSAIHLSAYGALRRVAAGESAGRLSLVVDEEHVARPFLDAWRARADELERAAGRRSAFRRFVLGERAFPLHASPFDEASPGAAARARALREARLCLRCPEILPTPAAVSAKLESRGFALFARPKLEERSFALWQSAEDRVWCASTLWDSVAFELGAPVEVLWEEALPAKGGGFSILQIGRWSVRGPDRSREVAAAAAELGRLPGVTVRRRQSHDC